MWREDNKVAMNNDGSRLDVREKVSGAAKYTTDYYPERLLWAGYIRSPYGSGKVTAIDEAAARAVPGVLDVQVTSREMRYPGDRLGYVVAEGRRALEAGLAALNMKFELNQPKTRLERERKPLSGTEPPEKLADVEQALQGAKTVLEAEYDTQVQSHCCLEPHNALVDFKGDSAIAYGSTQSCQGFRNDLAGELNLKQEQVEFHCEYVGGGFGSKFGMDAEGQLAAQVSKKFNRPCRVMLDRKEEQEDAGMRPGSMQYMKVGVDGSGKIVGARVHTWGSCGHNGAGGGVRNPSRYDFGVNDKTHQDVALNSQPARAMRAPGHPQGMFGVELMMDELAAAVGMDPVAFRTMNETSDNRREMFKVGAELIGWKNRKPDGTWPGTVKEGFGVGSGDWGNGKGDATVTVHVYRDGNVEVLSGSQDIGTAFRTMLADCVVYQLGVPRDRITSKVGVSTYPPGPASGGSVTSRLVAPRALGAAEQARQKLLELVAKEWKVEPGTLQVSEGVFKGTDGRTMDWAKACRLIAQDRLTATVSEDAPFWKDPTGSEAVQFAHVAVDTETGIIQVKKIVALQEMGKPVNRKGAENQITGGVIQGLSFALFENRILNRHNGAQVNPNMEFYKIAGSKDIPEIIPVLWVSREDAGVNSLGEPPTIPTPGAIGCAVANAIGARVRSMPLSPWKVLAALEQAKGGTA